MEASESSAKPSAAFRIALGIWVLALAAVAIEFGARAYLNTLEDDAFARYASLAQQQARAKETDTALGRYVPHRYVGHVPRPNAHGHNSLGFLGVEIPMPKPEGEFRIAWIGGTDSYLNDAALRGVFEDENARFINASAEDYLSHEALMNLQYRVLDLDPDCVIIDLGASDLLGRMVWPPEAYASDNSGMKRPVSTGLFMPSVFEYSTALRMMGIAFGITQPHTADDTSLHVLSSDYYGDDFIEQLENGTYPTGIFDEVPAVDMLTTNDPRHFERNMTNIALIAKANGIVPVFMKFNFEASSVIPEAAHEKLQSEFDVMNEVIQNIARDTQALYFDGKPDGLAEYLINNNVFVR